MSIEYRVVPLAQLKQWRRDLDACQKVLHLVGGFDPAYCDDAQECLQEMDAARGAAPVQPAGDEPEVLAVIDDSLDSGVILTTTGAVVGKAGAELVDRTHVTRLRDELAWVSGLCDKKNRRLW